MKQEYSLVLEIGSAWNFPFGRKSRIVGRSSVVVCGCGNVEAVFIAAGIGFSVAG